MTQITTMTHPMTPTEYAQYREDTHGCLNITQIHYKLCYDNKIVTGVLNVTDIMRKLVPTYYGSVVYAAVDSIDWYTTLDIPHLSSPQLDEEGNGFVTSRTPLVVWTPVGRSENPDTIYIEGVISDESTN